MEAPRLWGAKWQGKRRSSFQGWCLGKNTTPRGVLDSGGHHPIVQ